MEIDRKSEVGLKAKIRLELRKCSNYGISSISSVSKKVDEDEDELVGLELRELEKPDEQPIEVSDDENVPIQAKK